jgi:uncharacterized damage-inducible protein DinB
VEARIVTSNDWRAIVASALDWEQAHATLDDAVRSFPPALRGRRPDGFPHSAWELLEHIRITQFDLLDFMRNSNYEDLSGSNPHWPESPAPPNERDWDASIARIARDRDELREFTTGAAVDFTAKIPHGQGQTYLRTVLVAVDHTSYHVGQIIAVRRLLGAWPPE